MRQGNSFQRKKVKRIVFMMMTIKAMCTISFSQPLLVVLLVHCISYVDGIDRNLDRFNYDRTKRAGKNNVTTNDWGPKDWENTQCPDLDSCIGWPDKWKTGIGWELGDTNHCRWCPVGNASQCGAHHQSPINLERIPKINNTCIDIHWMEYYDSSCSLEQLQEKNAFVIDRHALRIVQPMIENDDGTFRLDCKNKNGKSVFGRIDFSKGFSDWWHLSHVDFHVPSEHTQEGKRYDGEIQMYHFYSVSGEDAGVNNEMASVTAFLQAYDNAVDWDVLNQIICTWRETEAKTREECGLPTVKEFYHGCRSHIREDDYSDHNTSSAIQEVGGGERIRHLRQHDDDTATKISKYHQRSRAISIHDIILENMKHSSNEGNFQPKKIHMSKEDFEPTKDIDWDSFISSQYVDHSSLQPSGDDSGRRLQSTNGTSWLNYFPMLGVRTEYYYRYSGSQTVPPCYGTFLPNNNREQTNHWRIFKDPIRISKRQLMELHRLLRERIAPIDDPVRSCKPDTASKRDRRNPKKVIVARPLQETHKAHFMVFCECDNWKSKWLEDQEWCKLSNRTERFYEHPYNFFDAKGF